MSSGTPTTPSFIGVGSSSGVSPSISREFSSGSSRPQTPLAGKQGIYQVASRSMGGITFADLSRWEDGDVSAWLQSSRLGNHTAVFSQNDISGAVLLEIDQTVLKEMGVGSVGDRIRIISAIKNLKKRCTETEAANRMSLQGEIEYLSNEPDRIVSETPASVARRSGAGRPPPLHLAQSAQDMLTSANNLALMNHNSQGLGLREARGQPSSGRIGNTIGPLSASNRSPASAVRQLGEMEALGHRKTDSIGASAQHPRYLQHQQLANLQGGRRPSTSTGESGRIGHGSSSVSPTNASFQRPSTSDGGRGLGNAQMLNGVPLTPISEGFQSSLPRSQQAPMGGYSVGRGALGQQGNRPITPSQMNISSTPLSAFSGGSETSRSAPLSLEDVKRRTIKFIGEDGTTRIVPVSDCRDAFDVLARVLKKFNKPAMGNSYTPTAGQTAMDDDLLGVEDTGDLWGIFATSGEGQTKYLTDNELLAICHAPQPHDPLRERGLTIRRINKTDESGKRPTGKRSKLEYIFGEDPQKRLGTQSGAYLQPPVLDDALADGGQVTTGGRKMNRASTSSILSGLGAAANNASRHGGRESKDSQTRSPPGAASSSKVPKKARNFFGQRPPSELISSHLADFFPSTEKRVLERTARRSMYGRPSTSIRSKRDSTWSYAADLENPPPLPSKESMDSNRSRTSYEAPSILIGMDSSDAGDMSSNDGGQGDADASLSNLLRTSSRPSLDVGLDSNQSALPPPAYSRSSKRPTSIRRASGESSRSRRSLASQLRMARGIGYGDGPAGGVDRSDAASMLTVDEITQEVESRRESMQMAGSSGGWVVDEDGVPIPLPTSAKHTTSSSLAASTRPSSGLSVNVDDAGDTEDSDDDGSVRMTGSPMAASDGTDGNIGDSTAAYRGTKSWGSNGSDLHSSLSAHSFEEGLQADEDDGGDDLHDEEDFDNADDHSDDEEDEAGGVYLSAAPGKEPIKWIKGALIGAGSFGNVFLGMNAKNGLLMAVKQVELPSGDSHSDQRKKSMLEALEREIELLKTMQHENIVQYLDSYADGTHLNIFLEYVPGGSVVALLRNYGAFEEPLVRNFVKQILHGLNFLHDRDIVHRDIKGANILVDNKSCIKISDFGISKKVESDLLVSARAHRPSLQGSVFWMAPEVVKQTSYTRKADIWSLGCLVVEMISGTHPWANLNQMQALFKIGSLAKPQLPEEISAEAVDFLNKTFELDYNARPSAEELLHHPFITEEFALTSTAGAGEPALSVGPTSAPLSTGGSSTTPLSHANGNGQDYVSLAVEESSSTGAGTGKGRSKGPSSAATKRAAREAGITNAGATAVASNTDAGA